jgi:primary-amine oxidase
MSDALSTDKAILSVPHPLHPLTRSEIEKGIAVLNESGQLTGRVSFSSVSLVEPPKEVVKIFVTNDPISRVLRFLGVDEHHNNSFDARIDVSKGELLGIRRKAGAQSPYGGRDMIRATKITKADAVWQQAVRKRGVEDFDRVQLDMWPGSGPVLDGVDAAHRLVRTIAFLREDATDNGYARPLHGIIAHVDLTEERVAYLEDHGVTLIPPEGGRYEAAHQASLRTDLKPIEITQPQGPSFTVDGYAVAWQKWSFRVGMHPQHGLVLYNLCYNDGGENRSILYRASLADMVVPYGDSDPMHTWKHVLDASEAAIGNLANSLKLGCDCLGEIYYFDINTITYNGSARTVENAICMHEEDYGVLWKHMDIHSLTTEVRRSRRLVISSFFTVGNYEYGFFWYLYMDGNIQMEVKLTGIVGVSAVETGAERPEFAPLIAPNLASPIHQHLFCFRLDFDLDGEDNSVYEVDVEPLPQGPDNPHGTQFYAKSMLLQSETEARRNIAPQASRSWKIVNPQRLNRLGVPVAYKLVAGATPTLFANKDSYVAQRAGFAQHNLWVTAFAADELGAAGDMTPQSPGGEGLLAYSCGRNIENTDVVVWHTFGATHIPRPEDWPVMPVEYAGFTLMPVGFFARNPALDVSPSKSGCA